VFFTQDSNKEQIIEALQANRKNSGAGPSAATTTQLKEDEYPTNVIDYITSMLDKFNEIDSK